MVDNIQFEPNLKHTYLIIEQKGDEFLLISPTAGVKTS